jgi:DNA-nicking Smr family endonuclease
MSRRRSLSDEEDALWRGIARSIKPLPRARPAKEISDAAVPSKSPAEPAVTAKPAPVRQPPPPPQKEAPPLAPLTPLGRRLKQRVARGREPIEARLDLHGHTQNEAHAALLHFLRNAQGDGKKTVLIVTGKGTRRSERDAAAERGVLKRAVPQWLSLPEFRPFVVGFEDAHIGHGGEGALYVRLRRAR